MDEKEQQGRREEELGALWKKSNERGEYFTGSVTVDNVKLDVVVFPNGYKREERHPDFRILKARGERRPQAPAASPRPAADVDDDRIPF
jgi:uncharacterized protein (DUF736 family)